MEASSWHYSEAQVLAVETKVKITECGARRKDGMEGWRGTEELRDAGSEKGISFFKEARDGNVGPEHKGCSS